MKLRALYFFLLIFLLSCSSLQEKKENHSAHEGMSMDEMPGMNHASHPNDSLLENLVNSTSEIVISNAATIRPVYRSFTDTMSATGYITYDRRRSNKVAIRTAGRIEKLYVKLNYQYVHKGDKILELYSPELNSVQEEFLHHLRTSSDSNLVEPTKQKLMFLGLTENQIGSIKTSAKTLSSITLYSPYDGYVLFDFAESQKAMNANSTAQAGMSGMNGPSGAQADNKTPMGARIQEGSYVSKGQTLFVINDLREVYGIATFRANETDYVKLNTPVKVQSPLLGSKELKARINFIEPVFTDQQKFMQARIYLDNSSGNLKLNSSFFASIEVPASQLSIPSSSVVSLGKRKFVWLKTHTDSSGNLVLRAREISTGKTEGEFIEVVQGISTQDEIAKDAGYLLDSESLIQQEIK